eukprot:TRINITY_DN8769_c0_g1_i1.p1 TRINITY_DN8769_c0_g1~~TRINITY_DN8769_c0_g1_i1.p1  ORF type:complete len:225 (+),score=41.36 TRINITY_DN8769_c0_g1_i1:389-1063(+)
MTIKLWDWDNSWQITQTFRGHAHYVMMAVFNPKDASTFASVSLDRTVKVWSIGSASPNFTLEGHEKGVNAVDYLDDRDTPYLVTGADDSTLKVWDCERRTCVQTLKGHGDNVSAVAFLPELRLILSGSEDGTVRLWHSQTYQLEKTLNYEMDRVWTIGCLRGPNTVAVGSDIGLVVLSVANCNVPLRSLAILACAKRTEVGLSRLPQHLQDEVGALRSRRSFQT